MASRSIRRDAVLGPWAPVVPRLGGARSSRWRIAGAWLLILATTAFAIPAYGQMKTLNEAVLGGPFAPVYALLGALPAIVLVGAGLLARWSHPASRIGVLLIIEGVAWNVGTLVYSATYIPAATEIAAVLSYVSYAVG